MCSELDFAPEKLFSSNYKNSQVMMTMIMIMRTSPLLSTEHLTPPTMVGPGWDAGARLGSNSLIVLVEIKVLIIRVKSRLLYMHRIM